MSITEPIAVILGFLLRLGIPLLLTATLIAILKRLDARWRVSAEYQRQRAVGNPGCWKQRNCPEEMRTRCRAFATPDVPCWQVFRAPDGRLQDRCLLCEVFRQAPAPSMT